jgi:copper chaperone NosL
MVKKIVLSVLLGILMWNCSIAPKEIAYGSDSCHYCRMTVVDQHHGSQLVTKTGKAFSFDSIECLINYLGENPNIEEEGLLLVNTLDHPGKLIDATSASFLVSPNLPSPMGANLTAFSTATLAKEAKDNYDGTIYDWPSIITLMNK